MSELDTKLVVYRLDPSDELILTPEQEQELAHLAAMPDDEIDLSDIPSQEGTTGWIRPGPVSAASGQLLLRDREVLSFFSGEADPMARINQVLREYIAAQRKSA